MVRVARALARGINWKRVAAVVLLTGVAVSIARCGREKEINAQVMALKEEQTRQELRMQQEYGCDIYGQYEYPYNTMSQDWSGDQVEGFYYHEITEECKKADKRGVPHRFLSYPRQYHQAQRRPFCRCRSCLPQRNQADK